MIIADELRRRFEPVAPYDFYSEIFCDGDLDEQDAFTHGKYCAIALEISKEKRKNGKTVVHRHSITNDLDGIDELLSSKDFCILAPISYAGKSRKSENARVMYALCVELDDLKIGAQNYQEGLWNLLHQCGCLVEEKDERGILPRPTFCVSSGSGIHLYYVFEEPLALFPNVVKGLKKYKTELTKRIWNRYVTYSYKKEDIQFESIFQAFRVPGTLTKKGERAEVFRTGERVSVEYMNSFIPPSYAKAGAQIPEAYKSTVNLAEAKAKWPEWYERRIVQGDKSIKKWDIAGKVNGDNPYALYDWWYRQIFDGAVVGKRYYCMLMLVIYAIKCDVNEDRLRDDCYKLLEHFDKLSFQPQRYAGFDRVQKKKNNPEENRFTEFDVECALQAYEDSSLFTFPINSIIHKSGIEIKKNKRNGRKRKVHLHAEYWINEKGRPENNPCKSNRELALNYMREKGEIKGRPKGSGTAQEIVLEWKKANPGGSKYRCIQETKLAKNTVYKWWDNSSVDRTKASDPWSHEWSKEEVDEWTKEEIESYIFLGNPNLFRTVEDFSEKDEEE